jgi:adenylylsulfate kinase
LRKYRDFGKEQIGSIMIAYLKCPLEFCMRRDPKGIYQRALRGEYKTVPGLQIPFEEPLDADVVIEADKVDAEQAAMLIFEKAREVFGLN